jgi:hypothetical protein
MNLFDFVRRNEFLTKVFPNGLEGSVYIGQIVFDVEGRLSVKIHTHQKPAVDVSKWGLGEGFQCFGHRVKRDWLR